MTEVAKIYLGNINHDPQLAQMIVAHPYEEMTLPSSDRHKGRIYSYTDSGVAVGIIKSRDRSLHSGDLFETDNGHILLINLQEVELLVLDFSTVDPDLAQAKLVQLGHVLGNHHYPMTIQDQKVFVQLVTDKIIVEKLINNLHISGLQISYQINCSNQAIAFSQHSH